MQKPFLLLGIFYLLLVQVTNAQPVSKNLKELQWQLSSAKSSTDEFSAQLALVDYYEQVDLGQWKSSIQKLEKTRSRYARASEQQKIDLCLAELALKTGGIERFLFIFQNKLQNKTFNSSDFAYRYNRLKFQNERISGKYFSAKQTSDSCLRMLRRTGNNAKVSMIFQDQAICYLDQSFRDSAFLCANKAIQFAKRSEKREVLVRALQTQAKVYGYFLDLEAAVQKELQAVRLAEELHNDFLKISSFIEIAHYSMMVGNWNEALGYLKRANQVAQDFNDDESLAIIRLAYSKVYLQLGNTARAIYNARFAERYFLNQQNRYYTAQCAYSLGNIAAEKRDIQSAKEYYDKAIMLFSQLKLSTPLAEIFQDYGQLCIQIGDLNQANEYLKQSLDADALVHSIALIQRYKLLSQLAMKKGDLKNALKFQNQYIQFLESNSITRNDSKIAELTSSNLREERERLIELQQRRIEKEKKEQEILKLERDRQLYISLIFIFAVIFSLVILVLRMKQVRSRQEQREAELSQTLLRAQMNPHFVFNAMSVIQSYIYENNPEKSSQFLVNFSRLMRLILENSPKEFIPIELELEILDKYLSTQKMRFENRFSYVLHVSDYLLFNKAMVSPMITQPFIENAIEHGQLHTVTDGQIHVTMVEQDGQLEITISDNGVGRKKSAQTKKIRTHKSMAIDITKERIEILNKKYKFNGSLTFSDLDEQNESGTLVKIVLPLKFDTANF